MESLYLVKTGEIILKLGNRAEFESALKRDLKRRFDSIRSRIDIQPGRYFIRVDERDAEIAERILSSTPGINGWSKALSVEKNLDAVFAAAVEVAGDLAQKGKKTFKVESRRSDKTFPMDSQTLSREAGGRILDAVQGLSVDVHRPDFVVDIEIRDKAYVHADGGQGVRGLPIGTGGRGFLLLSGGIDSPVAGYRMACRGLRLECVYFHAYPYTSKEAHEKVRSLARILARYSGDTHLFTVPFTEVQLELKRLARPDATTLYMRACMMAIADRLALKHKAKCLITGESLGQVASQTAENMRFTESYATLPVFRPLIGTDKEETIRIARAIGTYETSILPYEDCCVLFSPKHPILKADFGPERESFAALQLDSKLREALEGIEREEIKAIW
jgi:thiamine biosynthesis protein ThiI